MKKNEILDYGADTNVLDSLAPLPGVDSLGYGYDVRKTYANPTAITLPIIDLGPLTKERNVSGKEYAVPANVTLDIHVLNRSSYETVAGKTISEYRTSLNNVTKIEGNYNFFSGSLEVDFTQKDLHNSEYEFSTIRNVIDLWTINLPDINTLPILQSAKQDIDGTSEPRMPALEVLEKYGSHFIWEAVVGGRVDYSSATDKMTFNQSYDVGIAAEMSYENFVGSISASNKLKYGKEINEFNQSSTIEIHTVGGNPALGTAIATRGKEGFEAWANSVNEDAVLTDFTSESLHPIWVLCSTEERRNEFIQAFGEYMKASSAPIIQNDPIVQVRFTEDLIEVSTDKGSGADHDLAIYKPVLSDGYFWLGQYAQGNYNQPSGKLAVVKAITPGALKPPVGYTRIWDDGGSGNSKDYSCWKPIPPQGYVALGYIMRLRVNNQNPPSGNEVDGLMCIHEGLVVEGKASSRAIWSDKGSGADEDCSIFEITSDRENAIIAGTFYGQRYSANHNPNPTHPQVYCLDANKVKEV